MELNKDQAWRLEDFSSLVKDYDLLVKQIDQSLIGAQVTLIGL